MSGLLGILRFDGQLPDRSACERMLALSLHRGPDDCGLWSRGPVALGHVQMRATPEALHETQPLEDASGESVLVFDGRVDNRAELRALIQGRGGAVRDVSDAELVLQACQLLGAAAPDAIIGDFAFAYWDARSRRLLCARDPMGVRPFYYHFDGRAFRFASELPALLGDEAVPREPNEGMVGEYLACEITSVSETLYQDVMRLPPGHTLAVADGRLVFSRYWKPEPRTRLYYKDGREYAEHFKTLFETAVRCRLRSSSAAGLDLSGGLDSSSVACMARAIADKEGMPLLESVSLIFPGLACDESRHIDAVSRARGLTGQRMEPALPDADECAEWSRRFMDFPGHPNGLMFAPLWQHARTRGWRVCLGGTGGDEWLQGASSAMRQADHLRHGRLGAFARGLLHEQPRNGFRAGAALAAVKLALRASFPKAWLKRWQRWRNGPGLPAWLDADFTMRTNLTDRIRAPLPTEPGMDYAWAYHVQAGTCGWSVHALECEERCAAWHGFENRYPFLDRRLVEFALALPEEQRCSGGQSKVALREAMRGLLPESVRNRQDKATFEAPVLKVLKAVHQGLPNAGARMAAQGWIAEPAYLQALERATQSETATVDGAGLWDLWMTLGLELWLRYGVQPGVRTPMWSIMSVH